MPQKKKKKEQWVVIYNIDGYRRSSGPYLTKDEAEVVARVKKHKKYKDVFISKIDMGYV